MIWTPTRLENIIPKIRKTISKVLIRTKNQKFISKLFFLQKTKLSQKHFSVHISQNFKTITSQKIGQVPRQLLQKDRYRHKNIYCTQNFAKKDREYPAPVHQSISTVNLPRLTKIGKIFPPLFFLKKNRKKIREKTPHDNHLFQKNESSFFLKNFTKNMSYKNYFM